MKDRNDEAGSNSSQQTSNGGAEPTEIPTSNVEMDNHTLEPQESVNLKSALEDQDLSRIDQILREIPSLVYRPLDGESKETPLHFACRKRWRDGVMHLLNRRDIEKSFNQEDAQGFIPLNRAIDESLGYEDILEPLIDRLNPRDLNSTTNDNDTAVHLAAGLGNIAVLEKLCRMLPKDVIDSRNNAGDIPLHLAVRNGHLQAVKTLIAADRSDGTIPILYRNGNQDTPIHVAVRQGQPQILEELLKEWNYEELVIFDDYELRDGEGKAPLHIVAQLDMEDKATELLEQILRRCTEPDLLNEVDSSMGWTPLHFAASKGHGRIVALLLLNGADKTRTDRHGVFAADVARRANHVETAELISRYDSRSFRPGLEPIENNARADDNFLALSWPKWDKAVRQQRRAPTRLWPQLTPVHQLIFNAKDIYCKARPQHINQREEEEEEEGKGKDSFEAIELAPIHQAQISVSDCKHKQWDMKEKRELQETHALKKVRNPHTRRRQHATQTYLYESSVIQDDKRLTRWIHFPADNRAWIEDLCRCMYSHGSLQSEVIGILRFIEDYFEEVDGSQNYQYRKHGFVSQVLEKITDPPPGRHDVSEHSESTTRSEPTATSFGIEQQPGVKYSAYSLVFPMLDMDMIDPGFSYPPDPETENRSTTNPRSSPSVTSAERTNWMRSLSHYFAPFMGLNEDSVMAHWENMEALRERTEVHLSRSLDHYCHQRISSEELQKRVQSQVLTKFMKRQLFSRVTLRTREKSGWLKTFLSLSPSPSVVWSLCSNVFNKLRPSNSRARDSLQHVSSLEEGLEGERGTTEAVGYTTTVQNASRTTHGTQSPLQILVAPQLWLWKFDNLVITAFPERWDCTHQRKTLLDAIRERVEYLDVDRAVQPNRLVTEILNACADFQPTSTIREQKYTWTDAFDDEILLVSRDIKNCYAVFERDLGMSAEKFSTAFAAPTACLRSIDDVLDELTSIKRIFQDQEQVWEKVHSGDKSCVVCNGPENSREDGLEEEQGICTSNILPKRSLELAVRLEEDALKVRESVVTLLTLLQGEASTENTLKANEQSKILAVFTVVTVVFVRHCPRGLGIRQLKDLLTDQVGTSVLGYQPLRTRNPELSPHLDYEEPQSWITCHGSCNSRHLLSVMASLDAILSEFIQKKGHLGAMVGRDDVENSL